MMRVIVFGTFDLLHYGHVKMLEKAKELGGQKAELIVVIARDESVFKIKGYYPIFPSDQRLKLIQSLKMVDKAVLGYKGEDHLKVIEDLTPNIVVLGYDQPFSVTELHDTLFKREVDVKVVRLEKYGDSPYNSSSKIVKMIVKNCKR